MEENKCPKCSFIKETNKACSKCGYISENVSAPPLSLVQYFELPYERRSNANYDGPCPICKNPIVKNKCSGCLFEGNYIAVRFIDSLRKDNMEIPKREKIPVSVATQNISSERDSAGDLIFKKCPKCGKEGVFRKFTYHDPFGGRRCISCGHQEK